MLVKAARKSFGGLVAVNDLSFTKNSGEILGLIGPCQRRREFRMNWPVWNSWHKVGLFGVRELGD